jgi:hypothetical protein
MVRLNRLTDFQGISDSDLLALSGSIDPKGLLDP